MNYNWYFIFNTDEFTALGLVSKTYELTLSGIGRKNILVTKGELFGITYEGVFLALNLNQKNPFEFEDMAIHVHDNSNVFLGFAIED